MDNDLFIKATKAHSRNDFNKAKEIYQKILLKNNKNFKAHFLIGTLFLQENNFINAIHHLSIALDLEKNEPQTLMNLGIAYKENGQYNLAEKYLKLALRSNFNLSNVHNNLGNLYLRTKKLSEALYFFKLALQEDPKNYAIYLNMSDCYYQMSLVEEAMNVLSKIPEKNIFFISAKERLFNILFLSKNYKKCILIGEDLLNKSNDKKNLIIKLIQSYLALGQIYESEVKLNLLEKNSEEEKFYRALIYIEESRYEESKKIFKSLYLNPDFEYISHHNLGVISFRTMQFKEAIKYFNLALKKKPNFIESKIQLGLCQLSQCNFYEGWDNFYHYQDQGLFIKNNLQDIKKWDGYGSKKNILILFDQGIGDQIFFASLLKRLNNTNQYFCFINKKLINIFKQSFAQNFHFLGADHLNTSKKYDFYLRSTELGKLFINKKSDLKKQQKYLVAQNTKIFNVMPIGLSWFSSNEIIGRKKSIKLDTLIAKLKHKSSLFINLQYGNFEEEIETVSKKYNVTFLDTNHIDNLNDISGLANLILECSEVYSISNTTAHLAGALGVKVNLILPSNHQSNTWYWFSDENQKSLWYPTINICTADVGEDISKAL